MKIKEQQKLLNEKARVAALQEYQILDSEVEAEFENISFLASQVCNTPIALINFLDEKRQWFKSHPGLNIQEAPREPSLCNYTIRQDDVFEIQDTMENPLFKNQPMVINPPHYRFYAGTPLTTSDGFKIGTICVLDYAPKTLTNEQKQSLKILAGQIMFLLQERKRRNQLASKVFEFKDLFDNAPCGYHSINAEAVFLEMNETELNWLGYERSEVIGKMKVTDLLDEDGMEIFKREFPLFLQRGYAKDVEVTFVCKDGSKLPVSVNSTAIFDKNRNLIQTRSVFTKNAERKRIEAELEKSRDKFQKIFDKNPTAMVISDMATGKYVKANQQFLNLLGYELAEVIGKNAVDLNLMTNEQREEFGKLFREKGCIKNEAAKIRARSGKEFDFIFSSELMEINGETRALTTIHDITEIKTLESQLVNAKNIAEESMRLREQFLANMSHEIRTPMNAIIGFTDILLKANLQEKEKSYLDSIRNSGKNLLRIINDVLDISKLEANMISLEEQPLSIKKIFNELKMLLTQKAKSKNIDLILNSEQLVNQQLLGDSTRLNQILTNLIGNAIKFTKQGSITVTAKILKDESRNCTVEFSVTDTGVGIPLEKLQTVFGRFNQIKSEDSRNSDGSGLGLYITKQLVELQGGEITVMSKLNIGSTFRFTLPLKKSNGDNLFAPKKPEPKINIAQLSKLNILLAEDNPINIHFFVSLFAEYNITVDIAENGKQVIEKVRSKNYDIILMDMEMPEMDGYEATAILRYELKNSVPIIAMTAHAMKGEREKCLKLGMNDYVSKPVNVNVLFQKICNVTSGSAEKNNTDKLSDFSYLIESMRGEERIIRDTFDIILRQIPKDLFIIKDAIDKIDFDTIREVAHRTKSAISIIGAPSLVSLLEQMEHLAVEQKDIEYMNELNNRLNTVCERIMEEVETEKKKIMNHFV